MARMDTSSGCGCLLAMLAVPLALVALAGFDDGTSSAPTPVPSASDTYQPVTWSYQGAQCADGWPSTSIGERGACSHHGGVVSVWQGSNGQSLECRVLPPMGAATQEQELQAVGHLYC